MTTKDSLNGTTGYSSIPSNYDEYVAKSEAESVFGKRYVNPSYVPPLGTDNNTRRYSDPGHVLPVGVTDSWTPDKDFGTIGLTPDPKLNKPQRDNDTFRFPETKQPEDWRANTTATTYTGPVDKIPPGAATAIKYDSGKTDWSLMPFECIEEINKVLDFGAKKYAAHNWRTGTGFKYTRVLSSLLRHTFAWARGEDLDPESGLSHLSHMGCNVIFLIYYNKYKSRYSNDDRNSV